MSCLRSLASRANKAHTDSLSKHHSTDFTRNIRLCILRGSEEEQEEEQEEEGLVGWVGSGCGSGEGDYCAQCERAPAPPPPAVRVPASMVPILNPAIVSQHC